MLQLPTVGLGPYKSASQRARVGTESWGARNLFCPSCPSPHLQPSPPGTATIDYVCPVCNSPFQLKSQSKPIGTRIVDAAYSQMRRAIVEDRTPNLFVLHYDLAQWLVLSMILIPHFSFTLSALERRSPLAPTARRAGWIGCNILLDKVPSYARIPVVSGGKFSSRRSVRDAYDRLRPLENLQPEKRGWTLAVLNAVQSLGRDEFSLSDVYALDHELAALHPSNRHVRDKIRQQLQVLRDLGLLEFRGHGNYRLKPA